MTLNMRLHGLVQTICRTSKHLHIASCLDSYEQLGIIIRADPGSVGKEGTPSQEYERTTWPELAKLAQEHPEAGIHFQGMQRDKV